MVDKVDTEEAEFDKIGMSFFESQPVKGELSISHVFFSFFFFIYYRKKMSLRGFPSSHWISKRFQMISSEMSFSPCLLPVLVRIAR